MLHGLLKRQIKSFLKENPVITPELALLFENISKTYFNSGLSNDSLVGQINKPGFSFSAETSSSKLMELIKLTDDETEKGRTYFMENNEDLQFLLNELTKRIQRLKIQETVTKRKIKELESTNKELDQFAYIVSHDLKAPLRAISNLSQWVEDDIADSMNEQTHENFNLIRSRIERMERLINAILSYSKSVKSNAQTEQADTDWLVQDVIDSLNIPKNIKVFKKGNFPIIQTEKIKLQQIFSNLISNAIKYNDKAQGIIEVGVIETEDQCQFYVQDNGPGIEPRFQKKVFMIFQTLESKDDLESTGIGLAIVQKLIDEKGGKIWIESEPGKGARFVFTWPKYKSNDYQMTKP